MHKLSVRMPYSICRCLGDAKESKQSGIVWSWWAQPPRTAANQGLQGPSTNEIGRETSHHYRPG